ncbi:MAG: hypothetical protein ACRD1Z_13265, partial [Vicinamibacteria bacterium]
AALSPLGRARRQEVLDLLNKEAYHAPLAPDYRGPIHRLRMRKEREIARETPRRLNLKHGSGGILDVESIVQTLQLAHGRDTPDLKTPNTLEAIEALTRAGLLGPPEGANLRDGYVFLRFLESRLRLASDRSVDDLNLDRSDLGALALRMKPPLRTGNALVESLLRHRERIRGIYREQFKREFVSDS